MSRAIDTKAEINRSPPWLQSRLPSRKNDSDAPLSLQVYARLREAIVLGRIAPGASLREPLIAKDFGVSRTPVREALLRLRGDGLVQIRRQSGTSVSQIDPALVEEGILVRDALEPRVVEIAARKITDYQLAELSRQTERMALAKRQADSASFIDADDRFHWALIDASGFAHIAQIIERVNASLDRVRYLSASEPIRADKAVGEHRQLIELLRSRDAQGSANLLREHLHGSWVLIRELVERNSLGRTKLAGEGYVSQ